MRVFLIIIFSVFSYSVFSQNSNPDQVYLKDSRSIKGTIVEIVHPDYLTILVDKQDMEKYHYHEIRKIQLNDTIRTLKDIVYTIDNEKISGVISEIQPDSKLKMVLLTPYNEVSIEMINVKKIIHKPPPLFTNEKARINGDLHYVSFAPGIGNSYGMLGWRFQYKYGGAIGFAVHAGVGLYPDLVDATTCYNAGLKLMLYYWFYFDVSYGMLHREYIDVYAFQYDDIHDYYGYSYMIGIDYFFSKDKGFNIGFGFGKYTNDQSRAEFIPKIDIGYIMKIPIR